MEFIQVKCTWYMLFKIISEKMAEGYCDTRNSRITLIPFEQRQTRDVLFPQDNAIFLIQNIDNGGMECSAGEHHQICQQHHVPTTNCQVLFLDLLPQFSSPTPKSSPQISRETHMFSIFEKISWYFIQIAIIVVFSPLRKCLLRSRAQTEK